MTEKRDLKRRVRDRQSQTGESYMTALRQVQAQAQPEPEPEPAPAIPFVELVDLTELGATLGFQCRIVIYPDLAERVDPAVALTRLRELLRATQYDPDFTVMRRVTLQGQNHRLHLSQALYEDLARFYLRARSGLGGVSDNGCLLALQIDGTEGATMVMFSLSLTTNLTTVARPPVLVLGSSYPFVGDLELGLPEAP